MNILQSISIGIEVLVLVLGVMLALQKKKHWGWLIALCFAIYVFYDLAGLLTFNVNTVVLRVLFFIASISILWAVWRVYREV
ncbi:MAG: hypothetical protein JW944_03540 [Deltaproteobacteria bacterium]|nr:hypothetical protein [Deltaproteobacteria bacterium]